MGKLKRQKRYRLRYKAPRKAKKQNKKMTLSSLNLGADITDGLSLANNPILGLVVKAADILNIGAAAIKTADNVIRNDDPRLNAEVIPVSNDTGFLALSRWVKTLPEWLQLVLIFLIIPGGVIYVIYSIFKRLRGRGNGDKYVTVKHNLWD